MAAETYTIKEFCEAYGISRTTFYQMQREEVAPATLLIGRRRLISKAAAEQWRLERDGVAAQPPAKGATVAGDVALLAKALDCLTEEQMALLCDVSMSTVEAWRKRHKGPNFILAGNRHLYPVAYVREWFEELGSRWDGTGAPSLL